MNIREISDALQINRNSVAKYLAVLTTREEVEFKVFGKSKVYFLSQRVPVAKLIGLSSHFLLILNRDFQVVQIDDTFLRYLGMPRESVIGACMDDLCCDLLNNESVRAWCADALQGSPITDEISIPGDGSLQFFRSVLTPTRFPDNSPGIIIFFENITEKKQIESALAQSEENFRTMIDESGDGCVIIDEEGTITVWNTAMEEITGVSGAEAAGKNILGIITGLLVPEHRSSVHIEHIRTTVSSAFTKGTPLFLQMPHEIPVFRKDGQRRFIQKLAFPLRLGKKNHVGVIVRDITGRKNTEEELVREKAFLNAVMDSAMGVFCVIDENMRLVRWNRNCETVTGYTTFELSRLKAIEVIAVEERSALHTALGSISDEKSPAMAESLILTKTGEKIPYLFTSVVAGIADRKYRVILGVDLTRRKDAEKALEREKTLLSGLLDSIPDLVFFKDPDGRYLGCNPEFARFSGRPRTEIAGHSDGELYPEDVARGFLKSDALVLTNKAPCHVEEWLDYPDGRRVLVDTLKSPLISTDGAHLGILGISRDITERKNAENLLRKSEEKYRRIVETANEGIWAMDRHFITTFVNRKLADMLGYTVEEMIGCHISRFMHPDEEEDNALRMQNRMEGMKEIYERCLIRKNKSSCWVLVSVTPLAGPDGAFDGSFAMVTDITKRRDAEIAIRQSQDRFEQVADNSDAWIWEVDTEGIYRYSSAVVERILGYAPYEMVGKMHFYDLFPPGSHDELRQYTISTIGRHEPFHRFVNPALHKNGSIRILETNATPIYDNHGTFAGYRGCDTDITERCNLERARQDALEQIEKNIGQLAMLGDHIRNPLTVILAHSGMYPGDTARIIEDQVREVDRIISQIDRGWIESERVRSFLRKHSDIDLPEKPAR